MTYQAEREAFIVNMTKAGIPITTARAVLRHTATLHRLAEASCNGDWPADNGERKTKPCPQCGSGWAPSSFRAGVCPDCRTEALVKAALAPYPVTPIFQGDPRGAVVKLQGAGLPNDSWGGDGYCVPTRAR
jgi:hypothetical protein